MFKIKTLNHLVKEYVSMVLCMIELFGHNRMAWVRANALLESVHNTAQSRVCMCVCIVIKRIILTHPIIIIMMLQLGI